MISKDLLGDVSKLLIQVLLAIETMRVHRCFHWQANLLKAVHQGLQTTHEISHDFIRNPKYWNEIEDVLDNVHVNRGCGGVYMTDSLFAQKATCCI